MTAAPAPLSAAPAPQPGALPDAKPAAPPSPAPLSPAPPSPAPVAPPSPAPAAQGQIYASPANPAIRYRFDAAQRAYFFLDASGPVPARAVPVALQDGQQGAVLMCKLPSGKFVCHGLCAGNLLAPLQQKQEPPTIYSFAFPSNIVRVVNEGGKPAVRVDPA
jgi:hypothetical protein